MSSKCRPVVGSSKMNSVPALLDVRQVRRQFHALRFAAGERRGRLPQPQIAQPDIVQHLQALHQARRRVEEVHRLAHRELQHLVDVQTVVANIQNAALVARALALFADQFHVGQELHLHRDRAIALAGFAAAARNVERKVARRVAALLGFARGGEQRRESGRTP